MTLTVERLRDVLDYEPDTGIFRWAKPTAHRMKPGDVAGSEIGDGYRSIFIDNKRYLAHRLAWFYVHGEWPLVTDHINRDRTDNRISNLRNTTYSVNNRNRSPVQNSSRRRFGSSPFLGASWEVRSGKWRASIRLDGKKHHIGYFSSEVEAHEAYIKCRAEHHLD
jgi:hypothetical protein